MLPRDYRIIDYGYSLVVIAYNYNANYLVFQKKVRNITTL